MDIVTGITALATAGSALANLLRDLKVTEPNPAFDPVTDQVIELNSRIMDVQSAALALQGQNADLTKQVADLERQLAKTKDWGAEKEKYELLAVGKGYVYSLKPEQKGIEPHWICGACYEARRKSLLVFEAKYPTNPNHGYDRWVCVGCESRIQVPEGAEPGNVHGNPPQSRFGSRVMR